MQGCSCTDCRNDGKPQNKASRDVALIRFRQVRYTRILNPKVETLISVGGSLFASARGDASGEIDWVV